MDPADWRIVRSTPLFGAMPQDVAQAMIGLFFVVSGTPFAWLLAIAFFASSYLLAAALWRGFQQYLMSKP